jgi:signal transduction histidine kinase
MELKDANDGLQLLIEHDGIALTQQEFEDLQTTSTGLGMQNMSYRCAQIQAKLSFECDSNKGQIYLATQHLSHATTF